VPSLQTGFPPEARRLPLIGMDYDPRTDVLIFILGELSHLIRASPEIYVDEEVLGAITPADYRRRLRAPDRHVSRTTTASEGGIDRNQGGTDR
jgi:hypothetical protein